MSYARVIARGSSAASEAERLPPPSRMTATSSGCPMPSASIGRLSRQQTGERRERSHSGQSRPPASDAQNLHTGGLAPGTGRPTCAHVHRRGQWWEVSASLSGSAGGGKKKSGNASGGRARSVTWPSMQHKLWLEVSNMPPRLPLHGRHRFMAPQELQMQQHSPLLAEGGCMMEGAGESTTQQRLPRLSMGNSVPKPSSAGLDLLGMEGRFEGAKPGRETEATRLPSRALKHKPYQHSASLPRSRATSESSSRVVLVPGTTTSGQDIPLSRIRHNCLKHYLESYLTGRTSFENGPAYLPPSDVCNEMLQLHSSARRPDRITPATCTYRVKRHPLIGERTSSHQQCYSDVTTPPSPTDLQPTYTITSYKAQT